MAKETTKEAATDKVEFMEDPLQEQVNERSYTRPNVNINPNDLRQDIPEPRYTAPPINLDQPTFSQPPPPKPEPKPFNPEMASMPKDEQKTAVKAVAQTIISVYEWVNQIADKSLQVKQKDLDKLAMNGLIDFSIQVPVSSGSSQMLSLGEVLMDYNSQAKGVIVVTEEFKKEVIPVLERVLAKRGIGMSDENLLVFLVAKDAITKFTIYGQMRGQMNDLIKQMKEMTAEFRQTRTAAVTPTETEPTPEPEEEFYEEEFTGSVADRAIAEIKRGRGRPRKEDY